MFYSLVRLTLPGYNSFSRSLSVISPKIGLGRGFIIVVLVLVEGIRMDTFGELVGGIAFGSRGEVCPSVDNASS